MIATLFDCAACSTNYQYPFVGFLFFLGFFHFSFLFLFLFLFFFFYFFDGTTEHFNRLELFKFLYSRGARISPASPCVTVLCTNRMQGDIGIFPPSALPRLPLVFLLLASHLASFSPPFRLPRLLLNNQFRCWRARVPTAEGRRSQY